MVERIWGSVSPGAFAYVNESLGVTPHVKNPTLFVRSARTCPEIRPQVSHHSIQVGEACLGANKKGDLLRIIPDPLSLPAKAHVRILNHLHARKTPLTQS